MKIAIIGYGKMGHLIEQVARERGHEIVAIIDVDNAYDFDSEAFKSADVAIEFSMPSTAYDNVRTCFTKKVKVVSGTTGWFDQHKEEMQELIKSGENTLFWSSNFSVGVAIFTALNRYLAKIMNAYPQYDVRMEETHHIHKLDAPSGTAITLAENILTELDRKQKWGKGVQIAADGSVSGSNDLGADTLAIESIRRDEVPGIHSIIYDSPEDKITLTHDAHSRRSFALGAVLAAEYAKDHTGLLTMSDLFNF